MHSRLERVFLFGAQTHAQTVGDDFNDNIKDTSKWGTDISPATPGGQLVETNSRLEYYSTGGGQITFRPWIYDYGSYTQDWEAVADVNIGNVVLPNDSDAQIFMEAMKKDDFSPTHGFSVGLMVWKIDSTHFGRVIRSEGIETGTTTLNVSVHITFDFANKTLKSWYDADGSANGGSWTLFTSERNDTAGSAWDDQWLVVSSVPEREF